MALLKDDLFGLMKTEEEKLQEKLAVIEAFAAIGYGMWLAIRWPLRPLFVSAEERNFSAHARLRLMTLCLVGFITQVFGAYFAVQWILATSFSPTEMVWIWVTAGLYLLLSLLRMLAWLITQEL